VRHFGYTAVDRWLGICVADMFLLPDKQMASNTSTHLGGRPIESWSVSCICFLLLTHLRTWIMHLVT